MTTPASSSRILLLADRRVPAASGAIRIQRYRLARVPRAARGGQTASRGLAAKSI